MKSAGNSCTCFVCVLGFVGFRVSNSKNAGASSSSRVLHGRYSTTQSRGLFEHESKIVRAIRTINSTIDLLWYSCGREYVLLSFFLCFFFFALFLFLILAFLI